MTEGIALIIGINSVDSQHYGGWSGELSAAESDAKNMTRLAKSQGFKVTTLLTKEASYDNVIVQLHKAVGLQSGDLFMLYYSGCGGKLPDKNSDKTDRIDKTWCLYDRQFIDDELYYYLSKFIEGVRILVILDSCHSRTASRAITTYNLDQVNSNVSNKDIKYKYVPINITQKTYAINKDKYDQILSNKKIVEEGSKIKASVIIISGCQDNQFSQDGEVNSLFTSKLLNVWNNGSFNGSYEKFYKKIINKMPPDQSPTWEVVGKNDKNFAKQKPFII